MGKLRTGLATFLRILHTSILLFIVFGWVFPQRPVLITHIVFIPIVVFQWVMNQDRCVLTQWEHVLRHAPPEEREDEDGFVKSILRVCLRELPSDKTVKRMIWAVTWSSWAVSVFRVLLHK